MIKITVIGAGQLGSRHLQSLNLINQDLDITVVDPNLSALNTAKTRFEASITNKKHRISYEQELKQSQPIDIAIIASTAQSRRVIVEQLLQTIQVKHLILEKLLFTQKQDYFDIQAQLQSLPTKVWVNCAMRLMPYYQSLRDLFNNEVIRYHVTGSQFGLVTNAIHYLDHVAFLTDCPDFELDTRYLDPHIIEAKRPGYYELTGTLLARFANGSLATLHCDAAFHAPVQIEIQSGLHRVISREWQQKAWHTSSEHDWQWAEHDAPIPFQSTLTADLVNTLIQTNHCNLPDYACSMKVHLNLLNPLNALLAQQGFSTTMDYPFT